MTTALLVLRVVDALNESAIPFMIVGSFSSNLYGIPRSSQDTDFLLDSAGLDVTSLTSRLARDVQFEPEISASPFTGAQRHVANAVGTAFTFEFFLLSNDPHDRSRFERRRKVSLLGREVYVPSAEDVVITKLRWSQRGKRPKDLEDVRNVLAVQTALDWPYIQHWCDQHGTRDLLEQIRASLPPNL